MKDFKGKEGSFSSLLEDRLKADEKKKALLKRFRDSNARRQQVHNAPSQAEAIEPQRSNEAKDVGREERAFAAVRYGKAQITLYERDDPTSALHLEPWVRHLVNLV